MKKLVLDHPYLLPHFFDEIEKLPNYQIIRFTNFAVTKKEQIERIKDAEVLITDIVPKYTQEILKECKSLKTIITTSVGVDHIDLEFCKNFGIEVVNFPGYNARAVGEMAFANLISLLRKVPAGQRHVLNGGWDYSFFEGNELAGKNLGIIGAGNIGSELIKIGKGMGMNVLVFTKNPSENRAKIFGIDKFYHLDEVLKESDFLILAIPATKETESLVDKKFLNKMKKSSYLINISRPQVVKTLDLAEAIYEGKISGVALDIIESEPFDLRDADPRIQEMVNSPNVLVTPHIAAMTEESNERLGQRVLDVLRRSSK